MKHHIYISFLALWLLSSCQPEREQRTLPLVVCTTNIIADGVSELLGNNAEVVSLMGAGVDPHLYKASHRDLELLQNADVIVSNGLHLEGKMADVLDKLKSQKTIIHLSDSIPESRLIEIGNGIFDPHIWFDVQLWSQGIQASSLALQQALPAQKDSIEKRTSLYTKELQALHLWVLDYTARLESDQRKLVSAHDAFGYFGKAYQFEVKGLQGISTQSEYGLQDVALLVDYISTHQIKSIFIETSVPSKPLEAVVEGCIKNGWTPKIGAPLFSDALGAENEEGGNYIDMVKHNVHNIVEGLQ